MFIIKFAPRTKGDVYCVGQVLWCYRGPNSFELARRNDNSLPCLLRHPERVFVRSVHAGIYRLSDDRKMLHLADSRELTELPTVVKLDRKQRAAVRKAIKKDVWYN